MSTWAVFRDGALRGLLRDPNGIGETPRFSNAELLTYANYGIIDLSNHVPQNKVVSLSPSAAGVCTLPADLVRVLALVAADSTVIPKYSPHSSYDTDLLLPDLAQGDFDWAYMLDLPTEGSLILSRQSSTPVKLYYGAQRPLLTADGDTLPFGRHTWMEEALCYYTAGIAHLGEAVTRASLMQWSEKPENMVGNPFVLAARELFAQYKRKISENMPGV